MRSAHIDKVHVVRGRVYHRPEQHLVRDLAVEPDVLVGGEQPGDVWPDEPDEVAQHWRSAILHPPVGREQSGPRPRSVCGSPAGKDE